MKIRQVVIIGLGLIGGSIAKALKERLNVPKIIGIDHDRKTLDQALSENIICSAFTDISSQLYDSDIVFICTPVAKTLEWLKKVIPVVKPDCIITDVGSTKSDLINEIQQMDSDFRFVGGHPMTGSEKSGFAASQSHLFENAYYILTPCSKSNANDIAVLRYIVERFGSIPVELSPELHDKITGTISHVPHIISAALVNLVKETDTEEHYMQRLAAGGFKDITRISSSNPELWHNICMTNKHLILEILEQYIEILNHFKNHLKSENEEEIYSFFHAAKVFRDSFTSRITGLIPGTYELLLDIIDKPGIIGEVATLLGANSINIKNININNSREFEGGVLLISLPDKESRDKAYQILVKHGYRVIQRGVIGV